MDPIHKTMFIDTERVIIAVEQQSCIWNPFDEHYKNKKQRALAWHAVCSFVLDNYDLLEEEDRKECEKRVQQRWRTARDCYVKAQTRATATAPETPYIFMENLSFLEQTLRLQRSTPAAPDASSHSTGLPKLQHRGAASEKPSKKRTFRRAAHFTPAGAGAAGAAASSDNEEGDMTDFERQLLVVLKRMESPLEEDDESFFRSMAPILRTFDNEHKLLFRSRVMAAALELQMQGGSVYVEAPPLHHEEDLPEEYVGEPPEKKYRPPDADADEPPEEKYRPPDADADADDSTSDDS